MGLLESLTQLAKENIWFTFFASALVAVPVVEAYRLTLQPRVDKYFEERQKRKTDRQIAQQKEKFFENFSIAHSYKTGQRSIELDNTRIIVNTIKDATLAIISSITLFIITIIYNGIHQYIAVGAFLLTFLNYVLKTKSRIDEINLRWSIYFRYEYHKNSLEKQGYYMDKDGSMHHINNDNKVKKIGNLLWSRVQ